jgi:hypothetical protein
MNSGGSAVFTKIVQFRAADASHGLFRKLPMILVCRMVISIFEYFL